MTGQQFVIVDDHPLFRDALKHSLVASVPGLSVLEAGDLSSAVTLLRASDAADLVLLDLKMPGVQGLSGLAYLRAEFPAIPVVVVSASEEPGLIRRAIRLGASGYIPKSSSAAQIRQAILAVLEGQIWIPPDLPPEAESPAADDLAHRLTTLTPQQLRVLMMLREGLLNKQIAYELNVSEATVKAHVSAILQKLDVDSRTQAVIAAAKIDGEAETSAAGP